MTLAMRAWLSVASVAIVMTLLVFLPAGTLDYWQAWLFLPVFFAATALATRDLMRRDPALLARRMRGGPTAEKRPAQRIIMVFATLGFVSLLAVPGFDRRFGWSAVPVAIVLAGNVLTFAGFALVLLVYRANSYAFATIEVARDQSVVSTGPYAIVRHPMYASSMLYVIGIPLALGSWWGLVGVAIMLPVLIWRLLDEERFLEGALAGYREYERRVRSRLLPGVW